jgi:hypothetical protein
LVYNDAQLFSQAVSVLLALSKAAADAVHLGEYMISSENTAEVKREQKNETKMRRSAKVPF